MTEETMLVVMKLERICPYCNGDIYDALKI